MFNPKEPKIFQGWGFNFLQGGNPHNSTYAFPVCAHVCVCGGGGGGLQTPVFTHPTIWIPPGGFVDLDLGLNFWQRLLCNRQQIKMPLAGNSLDFNKRYSKLYDISSPFV